MLEDDPDMTVQPTQDGWLRVNMRDRSREHPTPIEGRFDIVQKWIAWQVAPRVLASLLPSTRASEAFRIRPGFSEREPVSGTPYTTAVEDDFHTLLQENGVTVARLFDYERSGGGYRPQVNELSHYAHIPLSQLLALLSQPVPE